MSRCENCGKRVVLPWRHLSPPAFLILPHDRNEWLWVCVPRSPENAFTGMPQMEIGDEEEA